MPRKLKCECGRCPTCHSRARARKTAASRQARIDGTAGEIARLRAALIGVGFPSHNGHCWCHQPNLLNPHREHAPYCLAARAALSGEAV
jgi:hypothetical protein